jgi:acylphosphatase
MPRGDVELVVEGESNEVEAFLAALGQRMVFYIDCSTVTEEMPTGWQGFHIRH